MSLRADPTEFLWLLHLDLFFLPPLPDARRVSAVPQSHFSLVKQW